MRRTVPATIGVLALLAAEAASACPVCYGETDSPMAAAADASILFMAILTYGLILSAGVGFVLIRRRALRRSGHDDGGETGGQTASA